MMTAIRPTRTAPTRRTSSGVWVGIAILICLTVNAIAAIVAVYLLGGFGSKIDALRIDHREEIAAFRKTADRLANHVLDLEEKVDRSLAVSNEITRLLSGARQDQERDRRRSHPER